MFFVDQRLIAKGKAIKRAVSCSLLLFMMTPAMAFAITGQESTRLQGAPIAAHLGDHGCMILLARGGNGGGGGGNGNGNDSGDAGGGAGSGNGGSGDNGGNGPGDGSGNDGHGPADGTGHGPGIGDCQYLG
jgi:hypothetical protein